QKLPAKHINQGFFDPSTCPDATPETKRLPKKEKPTIRRKFSTSTPKRKLFIPQPNTTQSLHHKFLQPILQEITP
ncbi:hypothetical protein, partial [Gluconobacter japonicus]